TLTNRLTDGGIPVVAHLGLTPQTVNVLGGYRVQGKDEEASKKLIEDAKRFEASGAALLVLECIPKELGKLVTEAIAIPTIGIGAGAACDGQVLVYHDLLQYGVEQFPKFVKNYADLNQHGIQGLKNYVNDVKNGQLPLDELSYHVKK